MKVQKLNGQIVEVEIKEATMEEAQANPITAGQVLTIRPEFGENDYEAFEVTCDEVDDEDCSVRIGDTWFHFSEVLENKDQLEFFIPTYEEGENHKLEMIPVKVENLGAAIAELEADGFTLSDIESTDISHYTDPRLKEKGIKFCHSLIEDGVTYFFTNREL